jgi:hypothetical protein
MGCHQLGERCQKTTSCCGMAAVTCRPDAAGVSRCQGAATAACEADGQGCAVPAQCCSGFCLPDTQGTLACRASCAPVGAPCAATSDCCAGTCGGEPGKSVCLPTAETGSGAALCLQPGEPCDLAAARCCAGAFCATIPGGATSCAAPVIE